MSERIADAKDGRDIDTNGDLYSLQGVHHEKTEFFVEDIKVNGMAKLCASSKIVQHGGARSLNSGLPERIPVSAQTIITETLKVMLRFQNVLNPHSPALQKRDLLIEG